MTKRVQVNLIPTETMMTEVISLSRQKKTRQKSLLKKPQFQKLKIRMKKVHPKRKARMKMKPKFHLPKRPS